MELMAYYEATICLVKEFCFIAARFYIFWNPKKIYCDNSSVMVIPRTKRDSVA